jgi:hypothetical protein
VPDVLACEFVLEFGGGDGDAVDREKEVEGLVRLWFVGDLSGDGECVGAVPLLEFRCEAVRRPEVGDFDSFDVLVVESVTEDVNRAAGIDLLRSPLDEVVASR